MLESSKFYWLVALSILLGDWCFGGSHESQLRIGKSVNIFVRYGYLSISMRVISNNDTEEWLFKEPTRSIYKVSFMEIPGYIFYGNMSPHMYLSNILNGLSLI